MSSPQTEPGDTLQRLIAEAVTTHEAIALRLGINPTDLRCLHLIGSQAGMTPTRLAELAGLTTGAITGVLDRLEAGGFVRREADPNDRRRLTVHADPARFGEIATYIGPLMRRADELSADWEPIAQQQLAGYLDGLAGVFAAEAERLRASARGGLVGDTYLAPLGETRRARLVLATGAPRLNLGGSALGQQVRMVAEAAATRLTLAAAPGIDELISASFVGPPPDVRTTDGTVTMRYRRRLIDVRSREIKVRLNPAAAWTVEVDGEITDLDGDLRGLDVAGLDVRGGVNHLSLRLPRPNGTVRIAIEGGTSDARITRPAGVPVALTAPGGVADLRFDEVRRHASATDLALRSDGWTRSPDRYRVEVGGGAARLTIREQR
jgi:DNA-binding MarR family transcriptional regulator